MLVQKGGADDFKYDTTCSDMGNQAEETTLQATRKGVSQTSTTTRAQLTLCFMRMQGSMTREISWHNKTKDY